MPIKSDKPQRKSLSKRTRFELFKRDSFTCQYCGSKAPDVLLEADHIKPVSKGGTNALLNLVTSCWDCNRGKSDKEITDNSMLDKQRKQLDQLNERRQLIEMMMNWHNELAAQSEYEVTQAAEYFIKASGYSGYLNETATKTMHSHVRKYGLNAVLEAVNAIQVKYPQLSIEGKFDKLGGVLYYLTASDDERRAMYIRGVIKNRFGYLERGEFDLLKKVLGCFQYEYILQISKEANTFWEWKATIQKLLNYDANA
jgi:hypothetical protein